MKIQKIFLLGLPATALLSACGPSHEMALARAQSQLEQARADNVEQNAPLPFQAAEDAYQKALRTDDDDEVEHLLELSETRVQTARSDAQSRQLEHQAKELGSRGTEILLEARNQEIDQLMRDLRDLQARQTDAGVVLTLGDILFDVDRATVKPGADPYLARLAGFLRAHPDRAVQITGHTDNTGSDAYNQLLSERRAQSVAQQLRAHGIAAPRIETVGVGESMPVASNATSGGRQQNRRVDILIENAGASATRPSARPAAAFLR